MKELILNFTAKSRYALKIMMDLAGTVDQGLQQRQQIAERQGVSLDFMDHILARLRSKGLIVVRSSMPAITSWAVASRSWGVNPAR